MSGSGEPRSQRLHDFQLARKGRYGAVTDPTKTTHVLQFTDQDGKLASRFDKLGKSDRFEIRVRNKAGEDRILRLPPKAAGLLKTALVHLLEGERVAVRAEDRELSPNDLLF